MVICNHDWKKVNDYFWCELCSTIKGSLESKTCKDCGKDILKTSTRCHKCAVGPRAKAISEKIQKLRGVFSNVQTRI